MTNGNGKIDWSNLWKNEDWWACWIGWFILILAIYGLAPHAPKLGGWSGDLVKAFPKGFGPTFTATLYLFLFSCAVTFVGGIFMKFDLKNYIPGFLVIFILSFISMIISKQAFMKKWGISYVLFALCFGLIISNVFKVPKFLKAAGQTEFFVKIGLVCMGATIMFSVVLKAGAMGVVQAVLVATTVWFMTYYICRKFGIGERFSSIIATANSICGVSATIAAGGAIQGDPKEISYMIAWVLVCAVVLILIMPPIAVWLNLPTNMAGAWLGGVIDNTGAVIAAGEILRNSAGEPSKAAVNAAAMVKMAQNVMIGLVAFLMALWATMSLDRKENPDAEKPSVMEVWYRFPKFVIGFMVASLVISFIVEPSIGNKAAKGISKLCKSYRSWFFTYCFVAIGMETNFKELISVGGGRPAIAYWLSQTANAVWTLFIAWVLWSGTFFTPAILPD
ncbi:MAG: putative sulfate exporter family transporter [Deltaproteobacteria bacterium]|nr:putative sulfate exporter family transporter [Deltaproteobacteria bacterium]